MEVFEKMIKSIFLDIKIWWLQIEVDYKLWQLRRISVKGLHKSFNFYAIRLKRELWNGLLHIIIGGVLAYVFLPTYSLITILIFLIIIGLAREYMQVVRRKFQPLYIHFLDVIGFVLGGLLWFLIKIIFNINPDVL